MDTKRMSGSLARTRTRLGNLRKVRANRQQIHATGLWNSITPPLRNRLRRHAAKPRYLCGPAKLVDQKYGLWIAHARHGNHSYGANANHSCGDPCNASRMERINTAEPPPKTAEQLEADRISALEMAAREVCFAAIKANAKFPSSVDIFWFTGTSTARQGNATLVKAAFTSKNALGNDLPFYGLCRVNDTGQLEHFSQTAR